MSSLSNMTQQSKRGSGEGDYKGIHKSLSDMHTDKVKDYTKLLRHSAPNDKRGCWMLKKSNENSTLSLQIKPPKFVTLN